MSWAKTDRRRSAPISVGHPRVPPMCPRGPPARTRNRKVRWPSERPHLMWGAPAHHSRRSRRAAATALRIGWLWRFHRAEKVAALQGCDRRLRESPDVSLRGAAALVTASRRARPPAPTPTAGTHLRPSHEVARPALPPHRQWPQRASEKSSLVLLIQDDGVDRRRVI